MKNPLLKHFFYRISDSGMKALTTTLMWVLFVGTIMAQTPVIVNKTECRCLNNATNSTNGQYLDSFAIETGIPGQNWRLVAPISGFYHPASPPPPANPILYLSNSEIPETSTPGIYAIKGLRVSGQSWSVRIRNMSNGYEQVVNSIQSCAYPNFTITGDANVCAGSNELYSLPAGLYSVLMWNVPSGATSTMQGNPPPYQLNVVWGPTFGRYSVGASGLASSYAGQPLGCPFTASKVVDIVDPAPFTTIRGDFGNCIGATERYAIAATASQLLASSIEWGIYSDPAATIPAMGVSFSTAPGTSGINFKTVTWPNTPAVYYLAVRGGFRINSSSDYCDFEDIKRIDIVNETANVSMACNNLVQLSMNPSCELYFNPDQFLEAQNYPNASYDIMIRDIQADTIIPNGSLGFKYIGKTLEVKVIHECSGNSCWGWVKIEDKSIPDLVCPPDLTVECDDVDNLLVTGYPVFPIGTIITPVTGRTNTWTLSGYDKCSAVTLTYSDRVVNQDCASEFSSIIERRWTVVDESGNSSFCNQMINVERADIRDVRFPGNWDSATGPNASLEACDNWPKIPYVVNGVEQSYLLNGVLVNDSVPDPEFTGRPFGTQCLKSAVTFVDKKILLCNSNKTYKLIRKWTVVDHCAPEPLRIREQNQLITVMDTKAPVVTCASGISNIPVKQYQCIADWTVLAPTMISDCNATTWTVDVLLSDANGLFDPDGIYSKTSGMTQVTGTSPNFTIRNLPLGKSRVRYSVTDVCGNIGYCTTELTVIDNQPPTPVCDRNSIIAIGANSEAYAGVLTFDDGSHDNCELVCMKIRRMDNLVAWSSLPCDNQLRFTCDDIGANKTVMVELYVEDKAGLTNTCMVEAKVQDNIFPTLTVPANRTANCYEDFTSLTRFGTATATDNCGTPTITETRNDQLNECGLGTITRTFTATDVAGNRTTRSQVITVENDKKFNGSAPFPTGDITWPGTLTLTSSCLTDLDADKLNSRPIYRRNTDCAQLAQEYEDIVFNFADNVCVKVLRQWKVIDWCQRNPFIPGSGEWTHTQLIMVNNTKAPDFKKGCAPADLTITQVGECKANVRVTAEAEDDCTPADKLEWSYTIDEGNDGSVEVTNGSSASINRDFPYGTHKITWTVRDGCKNPKSCTNIFTIRDDKKPSPYCISEIVTVIMPSAKEVSIWASDFDLGATDNCSTGNQLTQSFSATNRNDISRTITCADLDGAASKEFVYDVYTIDAAGNSDFCTVTLVVQDNGNSCSTPAPNQKIALRGNIYTESDEMVQNVNMELKSNQVEFPKSVKTNEDGKYVFVELPMYKNYTLSAEKNDDALNGVSTLDLVMIQRHILGLSELDSPFKLIAADVNNSSNITAADLVELRKLILGIQTEFRNNKSWRFVDIAHQFADPKQPFPYKELVEMPNLDYDIAGLDFIAVKIGDVNGSVKANASSNGETSSRSIKTMSFPAVTANANEIITLHLNADDIQSLVGLQMTIGIDNNISELVDISSDVIDLKSENLGFGMLSKGLINISWNNQIPVNTGDKLLTLKLKMLKNVSNAILLHLERTGLTPEVYTKEGQDINVHQWRLKVTDNITAEDEKFEIYQNIPNPFNATTVIGFNLPQADEATLKIFDLTGKMVYQNSATFGKGYNTFSIDVTTLNLNGVLYYQIDTDTNSATRKMIIIK